MLIIDRQQFNTSSQSISGKEIKSLLNYFDDKKLNLFQGSQRRDFSSPVHNEETFNLKRGTLAFYTYPKQQVEYDTI